MKTILKVILEKCTEWFGEESNMPYTKLLIISILIALAIWCGYNGIDTFMMR